MSGKSLRRGSARTCSLVSCSRLCRMAGAVFRAVSLISACGGSDLARSAQALLSPHFVKAQAGVGRNDCDQMMIGAPWQCQLVVTFPDADSICWGFGG